MPTRSDLATLVPRLFASAGDNLELMAQLEGLKLPPYVHVHAALLLTRRPFDEVIRTRTPRTVRVQRRHGAEGTFLLECRGRGDDVTPQLARVSPVLGLPAVSLLCVSTFAQWNQVIEANLDRMRPAIYRPFLRHWELQSVFKGLEGSLEAPLLIRLTRVSSLRRLLHRDSRRKYESGLAWTDRDVGDAFEQAREEMTYFRSVAFDVCRRRESDARLSSTGAVGYVSRDGHWSSTARHLWLYQGVADAVAERARLDHTLAADRGRGDTLRPARPIIAELSADVAIGDEDIPRIVRKLRVLEHAAVSVLHGNPYLRASVVDLIDGSSFDLVMASDRRIIIVPQLRATESAVTRICRFIYDEIGEADFVGAEGTDGRA